MVSAMIEGEFEWKLVETTSVVFMGFPRIPWSDSFVVIHNNSLYRIAWPRAGDRSFESLPYQLSMVV